MYTSNCRLTVPLLTEFEDGAVKQLHPTDHIVLKATTNAWYLYDLLKPVVTEVVVCHPPQVKLIPALRAAQVSPRRWHDPGQIADRWVPSTHVRDLRALINHRQRLISQ